MQAISGVRILEKESNKRGDLFGRLMADLFFALGYDDVRLNVHKAGREVDVEARHRTEPRRVVAECKATKKETGGDAINKFVGTLDAERRKTPDVETVGYFISLSGFKETAIEQEKDAGGDRVVLLDGERVIEELINGRIIVSPKQAMEQAGRCAGRVSAELVAEPTCELIAHEMGWVWVVRYASKKQRTHFALIHADGEAIASAAAERIIGSDKSVAGHLHSLSYLAPAVQASEWKNQIDKARASYFEYLASECGGITLEGLPADQDVGQRRLKLESIFVPLYLEELGPYERGRAVPAAQGRLGSNQIVHPDGPSRSGARSAPRISDVHPRSVEKARRPVGVVLSEHTRLAILGAPGGGKTTLLKRLAVAYAFPDRSTLVDDKLPDRAWLPLFIRCRQLGELAKSPIGDILRAIPQRAEMAALTEPFAELVHTALRRGEALLLIDGLDEISDEGARVSFVSQLRTFLGTYPNASVMVTSRVAGFRIVGGALSAHCRHYRVAEFDDGDITRLTIAWYKEVVGQNPDVVSDAEKLAKIICDTDRVRALATNPLLLTTLLLVKRWVGQLPTRRSVLYGKAIEVLLMTWNVEGYEPIAQEEAIPQLAFVAFTMMKDGVQTISSRRLKQILQMARDQMPEILAYARIGVAEFIQRVELRSSLMILSGHQVEDGTLCPMYEFRHLTFQEYLAARAVAEGYYPNRTEEDSLLTVLEPHLREEQWREVVALAGVLGGRAVQPLVRHLIALCEDAPQYHPSDDFKSSFPVALLAQCVLDEIQISPDLLEQALEWIVRRSMGPSQLIRGMLKGRYGDTLARVVRHAYATSESDLESLGSALADLVMSQLNAPGPDDLTPELADRIAALLSDEDAVQKAAGVLAIMAIAYQASDPRPAELDAEQRKILAALGDQVLTALYSDEPPVHFAACWALAWLGPAEAWSPQREPGVLPRLVGLWRESQLPDIRRAAAWAISTLPVLDRALAPLPVADVGLAKFIGEQYLLNEFMFPQASLVVGFYCKAPWTDEQLAELVAEEVEPPVRDSLLAQLGATGKAHL